MKVEGAEANPGLRPFTFRSPDSGLDVEPGSRANAAPNPGDEAMKPTNLQHPLEARLMKIRSGFGGIEEKTSYYNFAEGRLLPEEVTLRLQRGIDAFARERNAIAELKLAVAERKRQMPSLSAFCDEAVAVATRHYGGDAEKMACFGVEKRATAKAKPRGAKRACHRKPVEEEPRRLDPACGGANLIEEVVTTVVEEVVLPADEPRRRASKHRRPMR
jgi:hypothetical protein